MYQSCNSFWSKGYRAEVRRERKKRDKPSACRCRNDVAKEKDNSPIHAALYYQATADESYIDKAFHLVTAQTD